MNGSWGCHKKKVGIMSRDTDEFQYRGSASPKAAPCTYDHSLWTSIGLDTSCEDQPRPSDWIRGRWHQNTADMRINGGFFVSVENHNMAFLSFLAVGIENL
ncbi:hypothetical protein MCOR25_003911 [Pyricularia grisea]|nr:hypothetical protein MCOR25_003911 [Pyricularia grisea]